VDAVPEDQLLHAAILWIRQQQHEQSFLAERRRRDQAIDMAPAEVELLRMTWGERLDVDSRGPNRTAHRVLDLMLSSATLPADRALALEAETFADLFSAPTSRALLNVHFLTDRNKRDPGIDQKSFSPPPIRSLGVIGAGIMGAGIAASAI